VVLRASNRAPRCFAGKGNHFFTATFDCFSIGQLPRPQFLPVRLGHRLSRFAFQIRSERASQISNRSPRRFSGKGNHFFTATFDCFSIGQLPRPQFLPVRFGHRLNRFAYKIHSERASRAFKPNAKAFPGKRNHFFTATFDSSPCKYLANTNPVSLLCIGYFTKKVATIGDQTFVLCLVQHIIIFR
jgi:hypothetical protein